MEGPAVPGSVAVDPGCTVVGFDDPVVPLPGVFGRPPLPLEPFGAAGTRDADPSAFPQVNPDGIASGHPHLKRVRLR